MKQKHSIIWRRLDLAGHEYAEISSEESKNHINGTTIFVFQGQFCKLDYAIFCDRQWQTLAAKVSGFVGEKPIDIEISVDGEKHWKLNGKDNPQTGNSVDIDLNFSPVTNFLPIRRLNLKVGESAEVRAAWLKFPEFSLEPLVQTYERLGENLYRYESAGGEFVREIEVNDFGLVTKYPDFWEVENN